MERPLTSTALASEQNLKKEEKTLDEMLPPELMDYRHVSTKQPRNASLNLAPGTMPSTSKTTSSLKIARFTPSLYWNKLNWTNSSRKTSRKDVSDHLNPRWPRHSFSSIKKMENYDPVRITEPSTKELSRMPIHYPDLRTH